MPASMISAPTGGRPKVIGSSIATVAMVPMPGSTPTSAPASAPIGHSSRLIGVKATPKASARLEKSSAITPSLDQKTGEQLQRQPQRIGEKQAAADGQTDADDDGFLPPRFRRAERRDQKTGHRRNHKTERADGEGKGNNRQRDEQWSAPVILRQMRAFEQNARRRHPGTKQQQQD